MGSLTTKNIEQVIEKDGLENMMEKFEFTPEDKEYIDLWFNSKRADDRKEMIQNNDFDVMKA